MNQSAKATFSSSLGAVLTIVGFAVGLGNVWRFPYVMGSNGGSAFLLLFLLVMLAFGMPALMAELALGRTYRAGTITVLDKAFGKGGRITGYVLVIAAAITLSYYCVVLANVLYSAWFSVSKGFDPHSLNRYQDGIVNIQLQYVLALAVLWAGVLVNVAGIRNGIERVSKIFVPLFFVVGVYIIYFSLGLPGVTGALMQFYKPDFSKIGIAQVYAVLGQCYFSLGLGALYILVYGKYLRPETNIVRSSWITVVSDVLAALIVSSFIVPCVLVFGLELNAGPTLLFQTLPQLFLQMPGGRMIGSIMLITVFLIAFLGATAALQCLFVNLIERPWCESISQRTLLLIIGVAESILILIPALKPDIIGTMDAIFGAGFPLLGGVMAIIAISWCMESETRVKALYGVNSVGRGRMLMLMWMKYGISTMLIIILMGTVYQAIAQFN